MITSFKSALSRNISNIPGWRTKRKLVIIESDDWGSIRMPSNNTFKNLTKAGIDFTADEGYRFNKYDSLATSDDLSVLFEHLSSVKDATGRSVVFTPVCVVANPDFAKIQGADFKEYFYEPFTKTLKRYPGCENAYGLWKEGIEKRLFVPQFHGREHLNVKVWMRALKSRHHKVLQAFENGMWGISTANEPEIKIELQAAFDFIDPDDLQYQEEVIVSGLNLFQELFNYRATFFVPPNGPFSSELEQICSTQGIRYLSTSKVHIEPVGQGLTKKKIHWLGQQNRVGITYLTRNCFFEPSQPGQDWVAGCLNDIATAFRWHKPAVISSHRVNYIGALHKQNRDSGLGQLKKLLNEIMKKWPNTEFLTSQELGEMITND